MGKKKMTFKIEVRDAVAARLKALASRPKSEIEISGQDLINSVRDQILAAQAEGYTLDEIVSEMKDAGMGLGTASIKIAIRSGVRKPRKKNADSNVPVPAKPKRIIESAKRAVMKNNNTLTDGAKAALSGEY